MQIVLVRVNSLRRPRTHAVDDKDLLGYTSEIQFIQNLKARCGRQGAGSILCLQFTQSPHHLYWLLFAVIEYGEQGNFQKEAYLGL